MQPIKKRKERIQEMNRIVRIRKVHRNQKKHKKSCITYVG